MTQPAAVAAQQLEQHVFDVEDELTARDASKVPSGDRSSRADEPSQIVARAMARDPDQQSDEQTRRRSTAVVKTVSQAPGSDEPVDGEDRDRSGDDDADDREGETFERHGRGGDFGRTRS